MEALLCLLAVIAAGPAPQACTHTTANFVITAPTKEFAEQVGEAAEFYRKELAVEWTGREMPRWAQRCPVKVKVGNFGAGGATTFHFERGEVFGWNMQVQGTAERILDSVLPHEINHTIFACYFRRPLPRWADEGAASLIEHESERLRLKKIHEQVMQTTRKIPLKKLLPMKEYPTDTQQVLTLYAEGYSLADFLIQQSSKQTYLRFLSQAFEQGWEPALKTHFGYDSIDNLETDLDRWIIAGSPALPHPSGTLLAGSPAGRETRGPSASDDQRRGPDFGRATTAAVVADNSRSGRSPRRDGLPNEQPTIRGQSPELHVVLGEPGDWPRRLDPLPRGLREAEAGRMPPRDELRAGRSQVAVPPPFDDGYNAIPIAGAYVGSDAAGSVRPRAAEPGRTDAFDSAARTGPAGRKESPTVTTARQPRGQLTTPLAITPE